MNLNRFSVAKNMLRTLKTGVSMHSSRLMKRFCSRVAFLFYFLQTGKAAGMVICQDSFDCWKGKVCLVNFAL